MEATRRTVLAGTGALGVAAALTACGSASSTTPGTTGADSASSTPQSSAPQASAGQSSAAAAGGGSPLGAAADIPVGGGKVFADRQVVVTQPTAGQFKAFSAVCTHAGCTVGSVADGTIVCPCHGSKYKITDGSVVQGPAPRPLAEKPVTVSNGQLELGS